MVPLPISKLRPRRPLWRPGSRVIPCDIALAPPAPLVEIIVSKRVVGVGEPFDVKVIGSSTLGLRSVWWFGRDTGIAELDRAHWEDLGGETFHERIWEGITIARPGAYRFGANSRDVLYEIETGVPHQASEGAGMPEAVIEVRDDVSYDAQVDVVAARYAKIDAWRDWMKSAEIRTRYAPAWERSRSVPTTIKIAFRYAGAPLAYDPPWVSETQHMEALDRMAALAFPALGFDFLFGADSTTADVLVEVGGPSATSAAGPAYIYMYFETIFPHEFGHVLNIPHHYPGDDYRNAIHLPPGERFCVMARNGDQYCSGCRAAMHLDLSRNTSTELSAVVSDIVRRYPY